MNKGGIVVDILLIFFCIFFFVVLLWYNVRGIIKMFLLFVFFKSLVKFFFMKGLEMIIIVIFMLDFILL